MRVALASEIAPVEVGTPHQALYAELARYMRIPVREAVSCFSPDSALEGVRFYRRHSLPLR